MAWNWGQGGMGALSGAAGGAASGAMFGPWGLGIGAGLGGLAGLFSGGFQGDNTGFEQSPNKFSPEQQKVLMQLLQQGQQGLQNPTAGFEPIEKYARNKFASESIPSLAERFTAMGGSDTRGSSDFAGMLGGAQSEFDQGLAAYKAQYGQQGQQNALQLLQMGLQPQNENIYFGQRPNLGGQLLEMGGNIAGSYAAGGGKFPGFGGSSGNSGFTPKSTSRLPELLKLYKSMGKI